MCFFLKNNEDGDQNQIQQDISRVINNFDGGFSWKSFANSQKLNIQISEQRVNAANQEEEEDDNEPAPANFQV